MAFPFDVGPDCGTNATTHQFDLCAFLSGQPIPDCSVAMIRDFSFFHTAVFPPPVGPLMSDLFKEVCLALEVAAI